MTVPTDATFRAETLVVDDEERNRVLLREYLEAEGHHVREADGGRAALRAAFESPPDLILLDVMMPDLNGLEVCRRIKSRESTRLSQVVMVTALGGTGQKVEGLDCGADDYLTKPVRREEFQARVRSALRVRRLVTDLDEARTALRERNERLQELHDLKETLAQTLVHDLKNPLTSMMGNLELLSRQIDAAKPLARIETCRFQASRLHTMLLDLLDIAGLEEHRFKLDRDANDACELIGRVVSGMQGLGESRGVRVTVDAPGTPVWVDADTGVLTRIVENLVVNAVAHSPDGGELRVAVRSRPEGTEVSVSDEGPGIPEEMRERVFEKFARADCKSHGMSPNRGLGLTFCRLAVEAHGGVIWVEDGEHGGTVFRMILPAAIDPASAGRGEALGEATGST